MVISPGDCPDGVLYVDVVLSGLVLAGQSLRAGDLADEVRALLVLHHTDVAGPSLRPGVQGAAGHRPGLVRAGQLGRETSPVLSRLEQKTE